MAAPRRSSFQARPTRSATSSGGALTNPASVRNWDTPVGYKRQRRGGWAAPTCKGGPMTDGVGVPAEPATGVTTPLDAIGVLAKQEVDLSPSLRHIELYTRRGLLSLFWHGARTPERPAAVVTCGGAIGGVLGPAGGLYHRLGFHLADQGVAVLRVGYRAPNDLEACVLDVA